MKALLAITLALTLVFTFLACTETAAAEELTQADPTETTCHTHVYSHTITKAATETEAGIETCTCDCGVSYTQDIPTTGFTADAASAYRN